MTRTKREREEGERGWNEPMRREGNGEFPPVASLRGAGGGREEGGPPRVTPSRG